MSRWRDFLDGVEPKRDLESLLENIQAEIKDIKPRSLNEEVKLESIKENITEARLKVKKLKNDNLVLKKKVSIFACINWLNLIYINVAKTLYCIRNISISCSSK